MQLYALDKNNQIIFVQKAVKQNNYSCLECQGILRVREGDARKRHFYHLHPPTHCRQNGKSLKHIQLQKILQEKLGCTLETRFFAINRIADAVLEDKKVIFEIQCSKISQEELKARSYDYHSIGYTVIWIFHDETFNQFYFSSAEIAVRGTTFFYTNIDDEGCGMIYDQFDNSYLGRRTDILKPFEIDIATIFNRTDANTVIPNICQRRLNHIPIYFKGDLIYLSLNSEEFSGKIKLLETIPQAPKKKYLKQVIAKPKRFLKIIFNHFLSSSCR